MIGGTVNISRSLWDDEAFRSEAFSEREAWIWMIAEASWKPRKRRVGDYIVDLERGQLAGSIRFFAEAWQWSPAKVQRFLNRVQKMDLIRRKTDTGVTVVSICKYDTYQSKPKASDTGPIQDRYRTDTNENKGERRGRRNIPPTPSGSLPLEGGGTNLPAETGSENPTPSKRATRLPSDWTPGPEHNMAAAQLGLTDQEMKDEADRFRDYWIAQSGRNAAKLDWLATWRNWCRRAADNRRRPTNFGGQAGKSQRIADAVRHGGLKGAGGY